MRRVVSLFLPTWSTDRVRKVDPALPPEAPLVLLGRDGRRRIVLAADTGAQAAGLRLGMPASLAQVMVPGLMIRDADPASDRRGLERLALWLHRRYAPITAPDSPDGIVLDTTGADHLHGGETLMLSDMTGRLSAAGFAVRAAVADSWGAAHALARYRAKPITVAPPGAGTDMVAALPLAALRLPVETVHGLHALGFIRIGDLLERPRAPLTLRYGVELARRLDQILGRIDEPIEPVRPSDPIMVRRAFAEPIGAAETIARTLSQLVVALCPLLEARGLGARRLDLVCHRVDTRPQAVRVGTAMPVRDPRRLTRLLCDRIETIDPGFGIEIMTLAATVTEPLLARQTASVLTEDSPPDIADLVDVLANRVGEGRLYRAAPVTSDLPERVVRRIPALTPETAASWPGRWPRPSRLLAPPEPIETVALLPDHPPVWFTWRGVRRLVRRADGPERVFGEWWRRDAELIAVRDYFRVEDQAGERFWIFQAGDGEDAATGSQGWFLHGLFG
ncbi:Y-family DNA polymerase [Marinivivus vitaminiproducens]|uniref:Y-family DNA polymerase n=1 Tax=Marinivivus vitaminiproducens TaxID=3035935 RepID=UPI00279CB330|nr:DNA polymerase Y family protein [Geminicoccaceae bacterium SCSIO 64248]